MSQWRALGKGHGYGLFSSLGRRLRHPFAYSLSLLAMAVALLLPLFGWLALANLRAMTVGSGAPADFSLFMSLAATNDDARLLCARLLEDQRLQGCEAVAPAQSQAELLQFDRLAAAGELELPIVLRLQLKPGPAPAPETLVAAWQQLPGVDWVSFDSRWLQRLDAAMQFGRTLVLAIAALLALGLMVIVGNTVRLEMAQRRDEIQVLRLIGASPAFIRRPYLYAGAWDGLIAAVLALAAMGMILWLVQPAAQQLALSYREGFVWQSLDAATIAGVLAAGVFMGWCGAFLATTRHLREAESWGAE